MRAHDEIPTNQELASLLRSAVDTAILQLRTLAPDRGIPGERLDEAFAHIFRHLPASIQVRANAE